MTKQTPEQLILLSQVTKARRSKEDWRIGFEQWVRKQREEQGRELDEALSDAIYRAHQAGATKASIGTAYGTRDMNTINKILKAEQDKRDALAAQMQAHESNTFMFMHQSDGEFSVHLDDYVEIDHPKNIADDILKVSGDALWVLTEAGRPVGLMASNGATPTHYEMSKIGALSRLQQYALAWLEEQGLTEPADVMHTSDTQDDETEEDY